MKTLNLIGIFAITSLAPLAFGGGPGTLVFPRQPEPEPTSAVPRVWVDTNYQAPVWAAPQTPVAQPGPAYVYDQKLYSGRPALIAPEQVQKIMDDFKAAYPKMGSPRFLIFVNRDLMDAKTALVLTHRNEHVESFRSSGGTSTNELSSVKTVADNNYRADERTAPTLTDRQTVRDVERLFGRPLRQAGASLADQKIALVGSIAAPEASKDREALQQVADVVIEILISSKNITATTISAGQTIAIPDIQATAIRLSDAKILGQASSTDVTSRVPPSSLVSFGVPEITEATALVLMEDLTPEAK